MLATVGSSWRLTCVCQCDARAGGPAGPERGRVRAGGADRLRRAGRSGPAPGAGDEPPIDACGLYAAPGFIDMHVHGGDGADFMDGTVAAFETAVAAHARHGTTTIVPTSTVARHEQMLAFLETCREMKRRGAEPGRGLGRVAGRTCTARTSPRRRSAATRHCAAADAGRVRAISSIRRRNAHGYLRPGTTRLGRLLPRGRRPRRAAQRRPLQCLLGRDEAAYDQGVRHVDHLFCAIEQLRVAAVALHGPGSPMQAGIAEFVLATPA